VVFQWTVRHLSNEAFGLWRSAILSGHLGNGGGFVDEDKSLRIEARLSSPQGLTSYDDVFPILLGTANALFLNGSLRWRRKRKMPIGSPSHFSSPSEL